MRLGVEASVHHVAKTVLAKSKVLAELVQAEKLALIKAVYRLESGVVARLA